MQGGSWQCHQPSSGRFEDTERCNELQERINPGLLCGSVLGFSIVYQAKFFLSGGHLHFDNAASVANIKNLASELMSEVGNGLEMLMLVSQGFTSSELAGVEILGEFLQRLSLWLFALSGYASSHLPVVLEELLEVLGAQNVDLGEKKLTLDKGGMGVVQDSPDGDEILELAAGLFNDTIVAVKNDGHAGQVLHFGVADYQRLNVEAAGGNDAGEAGQHTRFVLDKAIEDVSLRWLSRWCGCLIEDVGDSSLNGPGWGGVGDGEGGRTTSQSLVGDGRGRAAG